MPPDGGAATMQSVIGFRIMWVEHEKYDFVKGRVRSERRWVDISMVVKYNALLS